MPPPSVVVAKELVMWFWLSVLVFLGLLIAVGVIVDWRVGSSRIGSHDHLPSSQGGKRPNPYDGMGSNGFTL